MANDTTAGVAAALADKPEAGKTTIDDKMRFGPLRLAYDSAIALAGDIASRVAEATEGKTVVIASTSLLADYANLQAALLCLDSLKKDYGLLTDFANRLTAKPKLRFEAPAAAADVAGPAAKVVQAVPAAAAAVAAGANPFVAAALGAISLLQTDTEFRGVETKVDRIGFELAVAGALKKREKTPAKVVVPDLAFEPLAVAADSPFRRALEAVNEFKTKAWLATAPLIRRVLDAETALDQAAEGKTEKEKAELTKKLQAELDTARRELEPISTQLLRTDRLFEDLQAQWNKIETSEPLSNLARLLRVEAITKAAADGTKPVYLHCALIDSGGHHRISRNLLRMIFQGDGLGFSGGAIARWALLAPDGSVNEGGMLTAVCETPP